MIINPNIISDIKIEKLEDLRKLKYIMEDTNIMINKSALARELNCDRRTIAKYLNGYTKPKTHNKKSSIDKYYDTIIKLLKDENKYFHCKRILWQYLKDNYDLKCCESSFRRYVYIHKELNSYFQKRRKGLVINPSVLRFETGLGEQAQLDWKESIPFKLKDGEIIEVNVFVLILSCSRFEVFRLSLTKTQDVLFDFLDYSFETFGGVPKQIITDNMKTIMDQSRTNYFKGKVNNKAYNFAKDYNTEFKPCIAAHANTKGKVESQMKFLEEIKAYNGDLTYDELVDKLEEINNRVNSRLHPTVKTIPVIHLKKEKDFLRKLPALAIRSQYQIKTTTVKVNPQSLVCFRSNYYSVPPELIGKTLKLQVHDNKLHLYTNTKLVALHSITNEKLNYLDKHYVSLVKRTFNENYVDIKELAKNNLKKIRSKKDE